MMISPPLRRPLGSAQIQTGDFENIINEVKEDDFVFIDPPYTVKHNGNGFIKYNESIFLGVTRFDVSIR